MAISPINTRNTNCYDVILECHKEWKPKDEDKKIYIESFNEAPVESLKTVYKNFDFNTPYKMIVTEGRYETSEYPYKRFQSYPYDAFMFEKGDYISFVYRDRMITTLIETIDNNYKYMVKGRLYHCNNTLNFINEYGKLIKYPVIFSDRNVSEFDISDIMNVTNGNATIHIRNDENTSTIKLNDRFCFDGQVYKVESLGNHNNNYSDSQEGVINLYLKIDMADSTKDDIKNNITDKDRLNMYSITCDITEIKGNVDDTGKIIVTTLKEGVATDEEVVFEIIDNEPTNSNSDNDKVKCDINCHYGYAACDETNSSNNNDFVMEIDKEGNYKLCKLGTCKLKAYMKNNDDKFLIINVTVDESKKEDVVVLDIEPKIMSLLQGQSQTYTCKKYINDVESNEDLIIVDISDTDINNKSIHYKFTTDSNSFTITNAKEYKLGNVKIEVKDSLNNTTDIEIKLKGMW